MDIDAGVEPFGGLENGPVLGVIQILVVRVRVEDEAVQLQLADGALHFLDRPPGRLGREAREPREAGRMAADDFGEPVVGERCELAGRVGIEHLHPRGSQGQNLHVHPELVHLPQALALEVQQSFQEIHAAVAGLGIVDAAHERHVRTVSGSAAIFCNSLATSGMENASSTAILRSLADMV